MSKTTSTYTIKTQKPAKCIPFVLWVFCFVIPLLAGKYFMTRAIEFDRRLNMASVRQNLINEKQKYKNAVDIGSFLYSTLENKELESLYARYFDLSEIYNEERIVASACNDLKYLKANKVLKGLPWGKENLEAGVNNFIKHLKKIIGAEPSLAFILRSKNKSKLIVCKPTFANNISEKQILSLLNENYAYWIKAVTSPEGPKIGHNNQQPFVRQIAKWFGGFYSSQNKLYWNETLYTFRKKDFFYHLVFTFVDAEKRPVNLNLFYLRKDFNWKIVIDKILAQNNKSAFKHSFGYSNSNKLPQFYQDSKNFNFVFKLPQKFIEIFKVGSNDKSEKVPVINIAYPLSKIQPGFFGKKQLNFVINFILFLSYGVLLAFYTGRFSHNLNLKTIISFAIMLGTLVPFTGLVWLGISYLNGYKHQQAGELLNFINRKIDEIERVINLKRIRTETLYHIIADRIERMSPDQRARLIKQINYYSEDFKKREPKNFVKPFIGYFLSNGDSKEILHIRKSFREKFLQVKPFFTGTLNGLMIDMGMFDKLSPAQRRAVIQKTQLADGVTEKAVNKTMFYNMLEYEGSRVISEIMPSDIYFYSFLLNKNRETGDGILTLIGEEANWMNHFINALNYKKIPIKFKKAGFNIYLTYHPLKQYSLKALDKLKIYNSTLSYKKQEKFYKIAQAVYANSSNTFINNISQTPSQAIYSRVVADGNIFALAFAEKDKSEKRTAHIFWIVVIGGCLFVSLLCLAYSTAQILLMSLPAFITAIEKVDRGDFNWSIDLKSGDEFEELAGSFNVMGRKLYEKEQMSQLVSGDVLEAVKVETKLETGGRKVYGSVLFSDLRIFTTLSEEHSAEEIVEMLNEYFTLVNSIIERRGG